MNKQMHWFYWNATVAFMASICNVFLIFKSAFGYIWHPMVDMFDQRLFSPLAINMATVGYWNAQC